MIIALDRGVRNVEKEGGKSVYDDRGILNSLKNEIIRPAREENFI